MTRAEPEESWTLAGGCDYCTAYRLARPEAVGPPSYAVMHEESCPAHRVKPRGTGRRMQAKRDGTCPACGGVVLEKEWIILQNRRNWVHEGCYLW